MFICHTNIGPKPTHETNINNISRRWSGGKVVGLVGVGWKQEKSHGQSENLYLHGIAHDDFLCYFFTTQRAFQF